MTIDASKIQRLIDRDDIRECVLRYTRGLDREDDGLLRSAFHLDAVDDHGSFIGPAQDFPTRQTRTSLRWKDFQHYVTNQTIDLEGDTAHTETYFFAVLKRPDETLNLSGGRYIDRVERREGNWAIADRVVIVEWTGNIPPEHAGWLPEGLFVKGTRDGDDPSYARPLRVSRPFRDLAAD